MHGAPHSDSLANIIYKCGRKHYSPQLLRPRSIPPYSNFNIYLPINQLASKSDVLIENFLPGKLEHLGLGYEELRKDNPSLIYCSITGYGPGGPAGHKKGYDLIAAGVGGLMHITGPEVNICSSHVQLYRRLQLPRSAADCTKVTIKHHLIYICIVKGDSHMKTAFSLGTTIGTSLCELGHIFPNRCVTCLVIYDHLALIHFIPSQQFRSVACRKLRIRQFFSQEDVGCNS